MPYLVIPPDCRLRALREAVNLRRCATCGLALEKWDIDFDIGRQVGQSLPLVTTLDGFVLASPEFQIRYAAEGWQGLIFRGLSNGYAHVRAERSLRLVTHEQHAAAPDAAPSGTPPTDRLNVRRSELCGACGRARTVRVEGVHVIARGEVPLGRHEFAFGALESGHGDSRDLPLIAGDGLRQAHQRAFLRGVSIYTPVTYEPWAATRPARHKGAAQVLRFPVPEQTAPPLPTPANDWPH